MENNILKKISKLIIDKRLIVFIAFAAACVYCAMSIGRVKVNDDITAFLPADTDTRRGLTVMEEEFVTYADAKVMLANTTYERAEAVAEEIRAPEGGRLYVLSDGAAVSHSFTRDGSYIVFALENGGSVIYAEAERTEYLWPAIGGGAAVIAAAGAYLLLRRKKKRPAPAESGEQAE